MDAKPETGQMPGTWSTGFVLSQEAARRFGDFTGSHIGTPLAIVLDGKVLEAPNIKNQINDQGVIEGQNSQEEAKDLALNLKAGSLPASVRVRTGKYCWPFARRRFHSPRLYCGYRGRPRGDRGDAGLLQEERHQRHFRAGLERHHSRLLASAILTRFLLFPASPVSF